MIISFDTIDLRKLCLATMIAVVLTLSALTQIGGNMQLENYVKFAIFILVLPGLMQLRYDTASIRHLSLIEKLVYIQIGLIFLGYFFAEFTAQIGSMIGFHVSSKHEFILSRAPFDPWKRSFSIFDNPNIAARLLMLTFLYYATIAARLRPTMLVLVVIAIVATGSRAALLIFVLFIIWGALFHSTQRDMFRTAMIVAACAVGVWIVYSTASIRIFDIVSMVTSVSKKAEIAASAFSRQEIIGVYDTDIALIFHQFGSGGLLVFAALLLQNLDIRKNLTFLACAYCLSGSLMFSTPNIALLLLLLFLGRPHWHILR